MAASLFPQEAFSRSNVIARTNCCTTQGTSHTLQRSSNLVRNERTLFSWVPRDCKVTYIVWDSGDHQQTEKKFLFPSQAVCRGCSSRHLTSWVLSEQIFQPGMSPNFIHSSQNAFLALTPKLDILCLRLWTRSSRSIRYSCAAAPRKSSITHCKTSWLMHFFKLVQWL